MNKFLKYAAIGFGGFLLLATIGSSFESMSNGATKQATTPTPTIVANQEGKLSEDESLYSLRVAKIMEDVSEASSALSQIDPVRVFTSNDERIKAAAATVVIEQSHSQLAAITPPVRFQDAHTSLLEGSKYYEKAMINYREGVDRVDADLINQSEEEMKLGSAHIDDATKKVKAVLDN